jgi:glutamate-ammonia-ligase adenylyltransferase
VRAEDIAPREAAAWRTRIAARLAATGLEPNDEVLELGALVACAYPAFGRALDAHPEDLAAVVHEVRQARDARAYRRLAAMAVGDLADAVGVRRGLRRFAAREKLRIALRELLALPGHDLDVTSRELSDLADVCCEVALAEALACAEARFGVPTTSEGAPCPFVVVGMGKLGGRELNAGSDIDLILFYETDDGSVRGSGPAGAAPSLHEHFTRVAQRFVATIDQATEDGVVWRVDLRLRPEGTVGPLVNALVAAERYYETWGRMWERAALLRARPVAGDLRFGERLLATLSPFVWRRTVDPRVVADLTSMLVRARAEAGPEAQEDLKIGRGGIREVEFFAQGLQLVWGGRDPSVRATNTLEALRRLRARGFVTEREERQLSDSYVFLRRLEHRIQFATGNQTHALPNDTGMVERLASSLGYDGAAMLTRELADIRATVAACFDSFQPRETPSEDPWHEKLWAAIDTGDEAAVAAVAAARFGATWADLPRHLLALARRADSPLGAAARDRDPTFAGRLVDALANTAEPDQAARLLAAFFARLETPETYLRALSDGQRLVRALCSLLGASAFLGEALVGHPDLADRILYGRGTLSPEAVRSRVDEEVGSLPPKQIDDVAAFVGALRRAKRQLSFEVGLADLSGDLTTRDAGHVLAALADATLEHACRFAMHEEAIRTGQTGSETGGLSLIAMGKLGGREIGYGSDLDLFFVHESAEPGASEGYARIAQRVMRILETPHGEGPGYQLDTRLRPSGSQGLLVVSLDGFARYQEEHAQDWERQALLKARACAGDAALGERVIAICRHAAYEKGAPDAPTMHRLRMRLERELGHERLGRSPARYDLKVGRGGLVDVEFATQWLQARHGRDPRVRTTETEVALAALEACGYIDGPLANTFREGWRFLRRLEQRLRISHGTSTTLLEEGAPGLVPLARRMGVRDTPRARAEVLLLERYVNVTRDVRAAYERVLSL